MAHSFGGQLLPFCLSNSGSLAILAPRSLGEVSRPWLQIFNRQIARLRTPAKATHDAKGKRHHAAILSSR